MYRRVYDHPLWRRIRPRVLLRDGYECQLRLPGCTGRAKHVHHIKRPEDGGHPFDPVNLASSCGSCNVSEKNRRRAEWARIYAGEQVAGEVPAENDVEMMRPW